LIDCGNVFHCSNLENFPFFEGSDLFITDGVYDIKRLGKIGKGEVVKAKFGEVFGG
jgi:hypothetical protein